MGHYFQCRQLCSLWLVLCFCLTLGCAKSPTVQMGADLEAPELDPVLPAAGTIVSHLGNTIITSQRLEGRSLTFTNLDGVAGLTRWQDKLVFSNATGTAQGHQPYLEALDVNFATSRVSPATTVFQDGKLLPGPGESYINPSADLSGYLYVGRSQSFASYKDQRWSARDTTFGGQVQILPAANGHTALVWKDYLRGRGELVEGRLTQTQPLTPAATSQFQNLQAVTLGRGTNPLIYVSGLIKDQANDSYKLGIYTPDLKLLKITGTDKNDKFADGLDLPFPQLAVTDKYICSWKFSFQPRIPAQICLWNLDGRFLGSLSAAKVLGEGWQPIAVTSWDDRTLILLGGRITRQEKRRMLVDNHFHELQVYTWEYNFFRVDVG
ncbi:MAG: hypothetical protein LKF34_02230 [Acidaminococcaceae bacterium]|jgi:hypothetical protein|nr:hypothetical protein [Acidaminococcaceae bacterium]